MRLLIDISADVYTNMVVKNEYTDMDIIAVHNALMGAIRIPEGHGRLIDADKTLATAWTNFYAHEDEWQKKDPDYVPIGRFYDQNGFECCQQTIVNAPTIIAGSVDTRDCSTIIADKKGEHGQGSKKA